MQTETVVRLRGRTTDPDTGEPIGTDWSAADELPLTTLAPAEPWTSGDPVQDPRVPLLDGWQLYLPYGADVTSRDRVRVRGVVYSVLLDPADWLGAGLVAVAANVWTGTCSIRHPGGVRGELDTEAGTYPTVPFPPHYTGGCRIQVFTSQEQRELFAEENVTTLGYHVIVDLDASTQCEVGDLVTITAVDDNGDPMLEDATLQLRSHARGSLPWQRDLSCALTLARSGA